MVRKDRKKRIIMPSRNNAVLQSPETSDDAPLTVADSMTW